METSKTNQTTPTAGFDLNGLLGSPGLGELMKHLLSAGGAALFNYLMSIKPMQEKIEALMKENKDLKFTPHNSKTKKNLFIRNNSDSEDEMVVETKDFNSYKKKNDATLEMLTQIMQSLAKNSKHDMDESISPLECNMDWVVDLSDESRSFIGRDAYQKLKTSVALFKQVGLVLLGRGVLREGQKIIHDGAEIGVITSGTFSPSLKQSIAIARIKKDFLDEIKTVAVDIRGNLEPVKVVKLPFVRRGKRVYE